MVTNISLELGKPQGGTLDSASIGNTSAGVQGCRCATA